MDAHRHLVMVVLTAALLPAIAQGGEAEIARFRKEYPAAGRRLEADLGRARGTCLFTALNHEGRPASGTLKGDFVEDHGHAKLTVAIAEPKDSSRKPVAVIFCGGNETFFKLFRYPKSDEYVLAASGKTGENLTDYLDAIGRFLNAPYSVCGTPLSKLIDDSRVRLVSADESVVAGRKLFRIEYTQDVHSRQDRGVVVFDPGLGWAVVSSELRTPIAPNVKFTTEVEYDPAKTGVPFPKTVVVTIDKTRKRCEFRDVTFEPTPMEEFTPEFYKLRGARKAGGSIWNHLPAFLGGVASLGFVGSALLMWVSRRPKA